MLGSLTGSVTGESAGHRRPAPRRLHADGSGGVVVDDPAHVPFPIWNPAASYPTGYKIVREGYVYQAKWYNTGGRSGGADATRRPLPGRSSVRCCRAITRR